MQKRNDLLLRYEPSYRPVQELATQIEAVQATIAKVEASPTVEATTDNDPTHELVLSELARSRSDLASLSGKATALQRNLTHDRARALELDQKNMAQQELLRHAKSSESNYLLYLHKQEEARISDALDEGHFMNVAIAESPHYPSSADGVFAGEGHHRIPNGHRVEFCLLRSQSIISIHHSVPPMRWKTFSGFRF